MTGPLPSPRKCNFTLEKYFAPSPKKQFPAKSSLRQVPCATDTQSKSFLSNQWKLLQPIWESEDPTRLAVSFTFLSINSISFCIDLLYLSYKETPSANFQEISTWLSQILTQSMEMTTKLSCAVFILIILCQLICSHFDITKKNFEIYFSHYVFVPGTKYLFVFQDRASVKPFVN